jgi:hypothetical protein
VKPWDKKYPKPAPLKPYFTIYEDVAAEDLADCMNTLFDAGFAWKKSTYDKKGTAGDDPAYDKATTYTVEASCDLCLDCEARAEIVDNLLRKIAALEKKAKK